MRKYGKMTFLTQFHMTAIRLLIQGLCLVFFLYSCKETEQRISCDLTIRGIEYIRSSKANSVTSDSLFLSSSKEFNSKMKKYKMSYESGLLPDDYLQLFNLYVDRIEELDATECEELISGMQAFDINKIEDFFGEHSGTIRVVYEPVLYKNDSAYLILNYRIKTLVANSIFFHFAINDKEWKLVSAHDLIFH